MSPVNASGGDPVLLCRWSSLSAAAWCLGGVDPGRWDQVRDRVEELQFPAVVVESAVVVGTEQDPVAHIGRASRLAGALFPGLDVCGLAAAGRFQAGRPAAAAVAGD